MHLHISYMKKTESYKPADKSCRSVKTYVKTRLLYSPCHHFIHSEIRIVLGGIGIKTTNASK